MSEIGTQYTSDGVEVKLGMRVLDYNREHGFVVGTSTVDTENGIVWYEVVNEATGTSGMFDGSRMQSAPAGKRAQLKTCKIKLDGEVVAYHELRHVAEKMFSTVCRYNREATVTMTLKNGHIWIMRAGRPVEGSVGR